MPIVPRFQQYCLLNATERLREVYEAKNLAGLFDISYELLESLGAPDTVLEGFSVESAPSLDWTPKILNPETNEIEPLKVVVGELIIVYGFESLECMKDFRELVLKNKSDDGDNDTLQFLEVGANPGGGVADHWCPSGGNGAAFGHRGDARNQIAADALVDGGHLGDKVNVVILDQGFSKADMPPVNFGGGIEHLGRVPGMAARSAHGSMVARSIVDLAPNARLYDVPLIPERLTGDLSEIAEINSGYIHLLVVITLLRALPFPWWKAPWVLVNPWAIFDRSDEDPLGDYTENTHDFGHPFNNVITLAVLGSKLDVVFAAGNCGQYCSDSRCTGMDRGPGRSIWGANAHPEVVTAGAVRADDIWIGSASQGPGPEALASMKPDLCASSQFREEDDAHLISGGTSAACAVTAGVVAALRGNPAWSENAVPPAQMKQALIDSARQPHAGPWSRRLGHGILNVKCAIDELNRLSAKKGR